MMSTSTPSAAAAGGNSGDNSAHHSAAAAGDGANSGNNSADHSAAAAARGNSGDNSAHHSALAAAAGDDQLKRQLRGMQDQLDDLARQNSKRNLIIFGKDVPKPETGVDPAKVFIRLVKQQFEIDVNPQCIAIAHYVGENRIVAEFLWRNQGSAFHKILDAARSGKKKSSLQIYCDQQRRGIDKHHHNICSILRRNKDIQSWSFDPTSGKLKVKAGGKYIKFGGGGDETTARLESFASSKSQADIGGYKKQNKGGARRRPQKLHQQQGPEGK
jgi:hypothetical protein